MSKWQYRCPNGHVNWQSRQNGWKNPGGEYYCRSCYQADKNPHFDELVDAKEV